MKPTTRGTLAAVVTGIAAAVGAATATPAAAVGTVPVPVPLEGAEQTLHMELPKIGGEIPLPTPGNLDGPRYVEGRLIPDRAVPQLPLSGGLPGADVRAPLPHLLGDQFDHVGLHLPAADLHTLAPGLTLDAPLSTPDGSNAGLPNLKLPQAGVLAPVLQTVPGADLVAGPGL
ncbi:MULTISPECIES: hypothetical protein [Streptomyces]|uniref:Secreted protein n=1 Tax=Streptomyces doudnae TaxID=3075536 RepID=A0ABD5EP24_9ACTN|nr:MULTISPECIES: hypothetical protein [unclassified Streptomyces]MDT0436053.1 hypothetical protein [Streptomyces sp. DSM 41981]MYQ61955.1 hypothetical protein [Streptomyces sp. SID4950]SCD27665.1 hypothetical protein GA0115242_10044 [Streptomyces sp. SolWspMP-5a-2]